VTERRVFASIAAQEDNLGDVEIRQVASEMASAGGARLTLYCGDMSPEYVGAFDLPDGCQVHTSPMGFALTLGWAIARRRAHLMVAPGPFVLPRTMRGHVKAVGLLVLVALVRATGGHVVVAGRALRGTGRVAGAVQRRVVHTASLYVVRDQLSAAAIGTELWTAPDLALAHSAPAGQGSERRLAVLSFRFDSAVDAPWVVELARQLRTCGLEPTFVTQVRRDDEQHHRLAELTSSEVVVWGDRTHREQLARVRHTFDRASIVVSNRLHAVILGLQHGAIPVVALRTQPDKVASTLAGVVDVDTCDPSGSGQPTEVSRWRIDEVHRERVMAQTQAAASQLEVVASRIATLFAEPGSRSSRPREETEV